MHRIICTTVALVIVLIGASERPASAQLMPKAQVANLIVKVENGVDEFRNYLEKRGENTREASSAAQASGRRERQGQPRIRRPKPPPRRTSSTTPLVI